jgi:hypothetical protein
MGLTLDLTEMGLGIRSNRYALVVEDGVVRPPPAACCLLPAARCPQQRPHPALLPSASSSTLCAGYHQPAPQIKALNVEPSSGLSCSSAKSVLEGLL